MSHRFPVPPGVVVRVVRAAADPETTVSDLTKLVEKDAVLSAQVLKTVNSALYALRQKVGSVERAIAYMGMRAVRNLVLSCGVRDLVPTTKVGEFPVDLFWESSVRRASAARCLAEALELELPDEYFTIGLCQDLGVLVTIADDASRAPRLAELLDAPAEERLAAERESAGGQDDAPTHDELGYRMFSEWSFPEELSVPIRFHHDPESAPESSRIRARVAQAAEAMADLSIVTDKRRAMAVAVSRVTALGLEDADVGTMVGRINQMVSEFAMLLGLDVEKQPTFEEIVTMASRGLVELTESYQQVTLQLEHSLEQQQRMQLKLEEVNRELEVQARTDVLTGLANRRSLEESLYRELAVAQRQHAPLSLLLFDIDHFKRVNDSYGHQAGDHVLERIGQAVREQARTTDMAARYGGEEFAMILPFTDEEGGVIAGERFRRLIESLGVEFQGQQLPVTASFGGATVRGVEMPDATTVARMIARADSALYRAKDKGRNCCCWSSDAEVAVELEAR